MKQIFNPKSFLLLLFLLVLLMSGFTPSHPNGYQLNPCILNQGSTQVEYVQVTDADGLPLFYYQDVDQYPCDDSVCARMVVRVYWDIWGNFLKLGLKDDQQLTKIGHKPFSQNDYERLHKLLNNPDCELQYYKLDNLTDKESEKEYYSVDAISSATIQNIAYTSVKGAVKTCYTLWNIVHGDVAKQIKLETTQLLVKKAGQNDQNLPFFQLIQSDKKIEIHELAENTGELKQLNPISFFCLIELARQTKDPEKEFLRNMADQIIDKHTVPETALYNYLLQNKFRNKTIRQYHPNNNYFGE